MSNSERSDIPGATCPTLYKMEEAETEDLDSNVSRIKEDLFSSSEALQYSDIATIILHPRKTDANVRFYRKVYTR
jgi:hypothetical protein